MKANGGFRQARLWGVLAVALGMGTVILFGPGIGIDPSEGTIERLTEPAMGSVFGAGEGTGCYPYEDDWTCFLPDECPAMADDGDLKCGWTGLDYQDNEVWRTKAEPPPDTPENKDHPVFRAKVFCSVKRHCAPDGAVLPNHCVDICNPSKCIPTSSMDCVHCKSGEPAEEKLNLEDEYVCQDP